MQRCRTFDVYDNWCSGDSQIRPSVHDLLENVQLTKTLEANDYTRPTPHIFEKTKFMGAFNISKVDASIAIWEAVFTSRAGDTSESVNQVLHHVPYESTLYQLRLIHLNP